MITRHTYELLSRLERAHDHGCAEIRKDELKRWYDVDRVGKRTWRDISERWQEIAGDAPLLIGDGEGVWTLIHGVGLTTSLLSWYKDIREWHEGSFAKESAADD
jgi:hypothetical protein